MPRAGAEPGQQIEARRDLAEAGEMVLDEKRAVIAQRLGLDIVVDEIAKTLTAIGIGASAPGLRTAEKSKPHCVLLIHGLVCRATGITAGDDVLTANESRVTADALRDQLGVLDEISLRFNHAGDQQLALRHFDILE